MIDEAYSRLAATSMLSALRYSSACDFHRSICSMQRFGYSSSGMPNFSIRSGAVALDEPRRVFGEVLRAFGDEIADAGEHLVAHLVGAARVPARLRRAPLGIGPDEVGIEVASAAVRHDLLEVEVEGHVVDAGRAIADALDRYVEVLGEFLRRALHRMAEADLPDRGILFGDRPGVDRHRVDVLQHDGVRADGEHVLAERPQMRHRAQARMMPPTPSVSAMVARRPYFFGTSKSVTVAGS